jgi:hypothetical protein
MQPAESTIRIQVRTRSSCVTAAPYLRQGGRLQVPACSLNIMRGSGGVMPRRELGVRRLLFHGNHVLYRKCRFVIEGLNVEAVAPDLVADVAAQPFRALLAVLGAVRFRFAASGKGKSYRAVQAAVIGLRRILQTGCQRMGPGVKLATMVLFTANAQRSAPYSAEMFRTSACGPDGIRTHTAQLACSRSSLPVLFRLDYRAGVYLGEA